MAATTPTTTHSHTPTAPHAETEQVRDASGRQSSPGREPGTAPAARLYTTWTPSGPGRDQHAVTDEDHTDARRAGHASPTTLCGDVIDPVSLLAAPGPRCLACQRILRARQTLSRLDLNPTQPGLLTRAARALGLPARPAPRPGRAGT